VAVELGGQPGDVAGEQRYAISADGTSYGWLAVTPLRRPLAHDTEEYLRIVANQTASLLRAIALYAELEESAVRDERAQLARELHDGLAQDLAVLRLRFGHESREAGQLVDRALSEARYAITVLRGHTAPPTDFVDAVRRLAEELAGRFDCPVEVAQQEAMLDVPAPVQVALLRIIREAVINAGKHGRPSRIVVALRERAEAIEVEVRDDGRGFDAQAPLPFERYGLRGIGERAALLGGAVEIASRPGAGTRVRVVLPAGDQRERSA
ncbi:MAG TPA: ATP-binding protein, partial [Thermomicrobiaceae bacterium]|nr:ATP-binding protein [Thermomicrobiaceae bacterium]